MECDCHGKGGPDDLSDTPMEEAEVEEGGGSTQNELR